MKILYGLPSEGMGHATRSKVLIAHLLKQHDVQVVTSDRAFTFLSQHFPGRVHQIDGFHLAYQNAVVSIGKTILMTLKNAPKNLVRNYEKYSGFVKDFNPDIVISDFESFTHLYAKLHRKPLISIDNMQVIHRSQLDIAIPAEEKSNYLLAKQIIKAKVSGADHYLITTFFHPPLRKKNTSYIEPILREEIIQAKTSEKNHILVYQTSTSQSDLITQLHALPHEEFIVYGMNKDETHQNVILKKFSEQGFISDFASCKAVIANGGFSFISEAVYLQKPILSVPIQNQFEQFVNASYIEKLGYGRHFNSFTSDAIKAFLYDLKFFKTQLKSYQQKGNAKTYKAIDELLKSIVN
jgi:uncharacterized protein (TIGR00661 family)